MNQGHEPQVSLSRTQGSSKKACLASNISTFCLPVPGRERCPVTCTRKANTQQMLREHFRYHIQPALDTYNKAVNKGAMVVLFFFFFLLTSWNESKSLFHVVIKPLWGANKACLLSRQYTIPDRGMKVSYSAISNHRDHLMLFLALKKNLIISYLLLLELK